MATHGILLHVSSLPNNYGVGSFGQCAYEFIDFLKKSNQKVWQLLPLGPTSYGDSPYQTLSSFAGNPYFIDLEFLSHDGLLSQKELKDQKVIDTKRVNYEELYLNRFEVLKLAFSRFDRKHLPYLKFIEEEANWIHDYALFMSIKNTMNGASWQEWPREYKFRDKGTLRKFTKEHRDEIEFWYFTQYKFASQWKQLHQYAKKNHIKIMGDVPIYVAHDSVDIWMNPTQYELDENLNPTLVAGVPPDAFSSDGQRWGNPLYRYDVMEKDHYTWWKRRILHALELFDIIRIDHFRGFEAYYAIPSHEVTAKNGTWMKGPGSSLWKEILKENKNAHIIAENLGFLTPGVERLLKDCNFPGMKVLQFTLLSDKLEDNMKTFNKNQVVYPGTHDNPPLKSWIGTLKRTQKEILFLKLGVNNTEDAITRIIRLVLGLKTHMVIVSLQDYLHLGETARLNTPGTTHGNWTWRVPKRSLTDNLANTIANLGETLKS
ncbi:MAG: 4-alpha-glucanotransferase [Bacilli bacterium]|nr:4-alpha-glucanotransferase [Bacilli bacterium]